MAADRRLARAALVALLVVAPAPVVAQARPDLVRAEQATPDPSQPELTVRAAAGGARSVAVWTAATALGPGRFVNAGDLAPALGGTAQLRGDRATVVVAGITVEVTDGVPFARVAGREVPLAVAPRVADGRALLPLQLVVEALPAASSALRFDLTARQLSVLRVAASRAGDAPPVAELPAPSVTLPSIVGTGAAAHSAAAPAPSGPVAVLAGPRRTVVVDAGHGGPDAGMRGPVNAAAGGPLVVEKDVTLGVARELRSALMARGVDVVLTRDTDSLIALGDRGRIANARRGDLFVSVHVNAANPGWRDPAAARGFETYFLSDAKTEDARQVAARENESVRFEAAVGAAESADPLRFIISDLAQNEHVRASYQLARSVQRRLARVHPGPNRGVHQAGFKVLVTASMPAVLVETGFGTNPEDGAYLTSARGQRELAEAIADAVVEHLARYGGAHGAAGRAGPVP